MKLPSGIQTILFDLDNTLIDRDAAMKEGIRHWLKSQNTVDENDLDSVTLDVLKKDNSGYTDRQEFCEWLLNNYANRHTKSTIAPKDLLKEIQEVMISYMEPNPELLSVLKQLKVMYRIVIATNGSEYVQQKKIHQTKLDTVFLPDQVYISEKIGYSKPERGFYKGILDELKQTPGQCIMVGDNYINDIEGARHCGMFTCWIDHKRSALKHSADIIFKSINETTQWL